MLISFESFKNTLHKYTQFLKNEISKRNVWLLLMTLMSKLSI